MKYIDIASFHLADNVKISGNCSGTYNRAKNEVRIPSNQGRYENNQNCEWNITAPKGRLIVLNFIKFDLEDSEDCKYDYLKISEGTANDGLKICGNKHISNHVSKTQRLHLKFVSDGNDTKEGFKLVYTTKGKFNFSTSKIIVR